MTKEREIEFLEMELREEKLKLERIQFNLKKQIDWLLEDFDEFKDAEATPENYASVCAIFKKTIRALVMSGVYSPANK